MEFHNKQVEGPERLARFQAGHYRVGADFDDFIFKGQLVQAEALKRAAEHWRRRKFNTAGVIFWQLNDCWPVSSWAVIDSALRPKAAYYYAKRFFAPVLMSCKKDVHGVTIWLTNDHLHPCEGELTVSLKSFAGRSAWKKRQRVAVGSNASTAVWPLSRHLWSKVDSTTHYLFLRCVLDDGEVLENRFFFEEPKHLKLPRTNVKARIIRDQASNALISVESVTFAKNVRLEADGGTAVFDDNYFDMEAGEKRTVRLQSPLSRAALRKGVTVRTLAD
jgi:beta-mannosidase